MNVENFICESCDTVTPHNIYEHVDYTEWCCQVCGEHNEHYHDESVAANDD